jgi:hypothetical protein
VNGEELGDAACHQINRQHSPDNADEGAC